MTFETFIREKFLIRTMELLFVDNHLESSDMDSLIKTFPEIVELKHTFFTYVFKPEFDLLVKAYQEPIEGFMAIYYSYLAIFDKLRIILKDDFEGEKIFNVKCEVFPKDFMEFDVLNEKNLELCEILSKKDKDSLEKLFCKLEEK